MAWCLCSLLISEPPTRAPRSPFGADDPSKNYFTRFVRKGQAHEYDNNNT